MDWYFLWKEKWLVNKFKYIIKPITDIYDIWKWTINTSQRLYKTLRVLWPKQTTVQAGEIFANTLKKAKNIKWPSIVKILWLLAIWTVVTVEAFNKDSETENLLKEYTKENWELDIKKIKKEKESLTKEQKIEILELIIENILNKDYKWINLNIENNILFITSQNKNIQWDWFITEELKEIIYEITWIKKYNFKYLWAKN
jgi:hypothetical protein